MRLVNKIELADELDVSRKCLDQWIAKFPDFPIVKVGDQFDDYEFDLAAAQLWVATKRAKDDAEKKSFSSPNARKLLAQAELYELEIAEKRNELINVSEVEDLMADLMLSLSHHFETVVPRLRHEVGLEQRACLAVANWLDQWRRELADKLKALVRE